MKQLCFGGSFNPIHYGHIRCAQAVARSCAYERVVLIPTGQPPHKPGATDIGPAQDRLAMCRLAVGNDPLFEVSDIETRRGGRSFTILTVRELLASGWPEPIHWLIGADMLLDLPNWREPAALLASVHFVIVARPGWTLDWNRLPPEFRHLQNNVVEAPLVDISASEIRRRVRAGESIEGMTPPVVVDYIRAHHLYAP
jgi:nicotinate-nucleotide adenylyltransferase